MSTGENGSGAQLEFTWDPLKAQSNIAKHGVSFVQAATVLLDALALTVFDAVHSQGEAMAYAGHVWRRQTAGGIPHLPAHRADQCEGGHNFSARGNQARTPAVSE